ncbi:orotidine-5'-phosphate decarboxylase [Natranaerobius trueperi]|uniref:Orotidine 5'-phosphate decarboxylase n=1 Tax=Natranaerobius trueperi TaxID=759412 RepID=A0A226BVW4_9FIRM|nr:orotidine-5'-phosphate decarboxylase [Natranaerobius trueperi]OWZ83188.1 orotidine-5'-phosphate decarboxylase [Natranaerobius trueperi]
MNNDKLIVALDVSSEKEAIAIVEQLGDQVNYYKVGMELFYSAGPEIIKKLRKYDKQVFLDLKCHDIPNTVAKTGKVLTELGVSMFNLHISGGREMMERTVEHVQNKAEHLGITPPKILGVTILTSIDNETFQKEIGFSGSIEQKVKEYALLAKSSGLDGVVASAKEAAIISEACPENFSIVTPGIRPKFSTKGDQKRTLSPKEALQKGSTHLVIGRPITGYHDRESKIHAVSKIYEEMFNYEGGF